MQLGCKSIRKNTCLVNLGSKWTEGNLSGIFSRWPTLKKGRLGIYNRNLIQLILTPE